MREEMDSDSHWMPEALRLAEQGFTPPNPMVGCVIVRDGVLVGSGFHPYAGQLHAERYALQAAGEKAAGATAYVTLEPCCHFGRTSPCTDALIEARIKRVVVAVADPNPQVSGKGIAQLQNAGIDVTIGVEEQTARKLNAAFFHFQTTRTPLVTLKSAMTLDGKIATRTGDSKWITGEKSRHYVHRLRARSGAVMVGISTLLADDALLTARLDPMPPRQPLRIVVDSHLRTPSGSAAVRFAVENPSLAPLLIATTEQASEARAETLQSDSVEILRLPATESGRVNLAALMQILAKRQIISVLSEGGGELNAALMQSNLAHRVLFFIAPRLVGGRQAPTPIEGEGYAQMREARSLHDTEIHRMDSDFVIAGSLIAAESDKK